MVVWEDDRQGHVNVFGCILECLESTSGGEQEQRGYGAIFAILAAIGLMLLALMVLVERTLRK
ncbi:MAG: hypothetical protein HXS42_14975 [Theionarchaea archaeon]|nr:hypothetical protein [Theionarchaea archaeon]